MADIFSKKKRSEIMSGIRGTGNLSTEGEFVKLLRKNKISGWRRSNRKIIGTPDLIFKSERIAIFLDGCFWHGCPKHGTIPKSNAKFWKNKIEANKKRDRRMNRELGKAGWKVLRIWEHKIKKNSDKPVNGIFKFLK